MIARVAFAKRVCPLAALALSLAAAACGPAQQATATASPPQESPLQFVGEWGMKGDGPGELADPVGIAVDLTDRAYLADRKTGLLQKFELNGVPSLAYSDASVRTASALAVDSGGAIYVADARGGRVWIHFPDGDLLRNLRIAPQHSADAFSAFCITADGRIIVPDTDGGRIQAFTPAGHLVAMWKLPPSVDGKAARPVSVAAGLDEFVYIADSTSGRIFKYSDQGAQVALWDPPANALGPLRAVAVSRKHVFALRGVNPQLEVWTFEGVRVLSDALGGRFQPAAPPASVFFAVSRDEQILLLDPAKPGILRFRLNLPSP